MKSSKRHDVLLSLIFLMKCFSKSFFKIRLLSKNRPMYICCLFFIIGKIVLLIVCTEAYNQFYYLSFAQKLTTKAHNKCMPRKNGLKQTKYKIAIIFT